MISQQLILCLFLSYAARSPADAGKVTVVYTSDAQPYMEALDGLRAELGGAPVMVDLHAANGRAQLASSVDGSQSRVVVAIGRDALEATQERKGEAPVVATMIMHSELSGRQSVAGGVRLDIPLSAILGEVKTVFPQKNRVAVLRDAGAPGQVDAAALARARQLGFTVQVIDLTKPEELLPILRSLKGRADFVVCLPDSTLYNSATVKPLILAALESHLPIVGFSQNFVRAGAALGVYPDFRDVGAQTAEIAQKQLAGQAAGPVEGPRKLVVGVNQRVMRLLGLEFREGGSVVTIR